MYIILYNKYKLDLILSEQQNITQNNHNKTLHKNKYLIKYTEDITI